MWIGMDFEQRVELLKAYAERLKERSLAKGISIDTGKPLWESKAEKDAMVNKVAISIEAHRKLRTRRAQGAGGCAGHHPFQAARCGGGAGAIQYAGTFAQRAYRASAAGGEYDCFQAQRIWRRWQQMRWRSVLGRRVAAGVL
jgi:hypothetical protein